MRIKKLKQPFSGFKAFFLVEKTKYVLFFCLKDPFLHIKNMIFTSIVTKSIKFN